MLRSTRGVTRLTGEDATKWNRSTGYLYESPFHVLAMARPLVHIHRSYRTINYGSNFTGVGLPGRREAVSGDVSEDLPDHVPSTNHYQGLQT
jgi:hypothetical protein